MHIVVSYYLTLDIIKPITFVGRYMGLINPICYVSHWLLEAKKWYNHWGGGCVVHRAFLPRPQNGDQEEHEKNKWGKKNLYISKCNMYESRVSHVEIGSRQGQSHPLIKATKNFYASSKIAYKGL